MMRRVTDLKIVVCLSLCVVVVAALRDCTSDDFQYEYTQCDSGDHRWRVSVPSGHNLCSVSGESPPISAPDCNFECAEGNYLDLKANKCKPCGSGTYSSGSSIRFEDWVEPLPDEFHANTESIIGFLEEDSQESANCSWNQWQAKGGYLRALPGDCASTLTFSGNLVKPGTMEFDFQYPQSGISAIFHVTVQNSQCRSLTDKSSSSWPSETEEGQWKTESLDLKSGYNVVNFRVIGMEASGKNTRPILIRQITVAGMAYSSQCTKCRAGTYSSEGARHCTMCKANTFSAKGAATCTPCDQNTQYSEKGATQCIERPACHETDFYKYHMPCDENNKTSVIYKWIEPRICLPNLPESVKLPDNGEPTDCPPCNPGMQLVNNTCQFCPKDHYSQGNQCNLCPASTSPDYSYDFRWWNSLPQGVSSLCVPFNGDNCVDDTQWLPFGDYIVTHFSRGENAYLVLQVKVPGFRTTSFASDGSSMIVGIVSFTFETSCKDVNCQLVMLSDETGGQEVVKSWEGTQPKQMFSYQVKQNRTMKFTWAFQNSGWEATDSDYNNSTAKIYNIQISNTMTGGAEKCEKCPQGFDGSGCIPCPDGHYIDPTSVTCVQCPTGTVISSHNAYGASSCKTCGPGLKPYNGRVCISDGIFTDGLGRDYDLRNLSSFHFVKGSMLFTSGGTKFFHGFNISMFGDPNDSQVTCSNNVTKSETEYTGPAGRPDIASSTDESDDDEATSHEQKEVNAMICRSTMIPSESDTTVMATQATSLGDHLVKIVWNETSLSMKNDSSINIGSLYNISGFDTSEVESDIQVLFAALTPTRACPEGRQTLISLRCDLDEKENGVIHLPPKCADGTCDGCIFHFMWRSRVACPVCRKEEFKRVVGVCEQDHQTIHYFAPAHCIVRDELQHLEETQKCTMRLSALPIVVQIAVPAIVTLAAILFICLCFIWRKNRNLEYKYMKLVEGSGPGNDCELPGVDSCALEEGEFDEQGDSVQIRDSKGARFFKKLKNKISKFGSSSSDEDAFDTAMMNERMPLT